MLATARSLNPSIPVVVRAENAEEAQLLANEGVEHVLHAKAALADAMVDAALKALPAAPGSSAAAISAA
jgi:hypothetical protein